MKNKIYGAEFKTLGPEAGPGTFEALVAVFDNVDRQGDRIKSSAFDETLEAWRKSGDPIPIILSHKWDDPWALIGHADPNDVRAIPGKGLYVKKGVLDIENNEVAAQLYRLMDQRLIKEFSFGYRIKDGGETLAEDGAYDLTNLDLIEFGPCLKGANEDTQLLGVKSALDHMKRERSGDEPSLADRLDRLEEIIEGKAYAEIAGTYEARMEAVRAAVDAAYRSDAEGDSTYASIEGTTTDTVTFCVYDMVEGTRTTYQAPYEMAANGDVTLGDAVEVELIARVVEKDDEEIETKDELDVETKAWDGSASNYTDAEYAKACIVDRGSDYDGKARYAVPIARPGNSFTDPDPDALGPAAGALAGARNPLSNVSAAQKKTAYKRLLAAYRKLDIEPPDSVVQGAKAAVEIDDDLFLKQQELEAVERSAELPDFPDEPTDVEVYAGRKSAINLAVQGLEIELLEADVDIPEPILEAKSMPVETGDQLQAFAARLVRGYEMLGRDVPDSILEAAGDLGKADDEPVEDIDELYVALRQIDALEYDTGLEGKDADPEPEPDADAELAAKRDAILDEVDRLGRKYTAAGQDRPAILEEIRGMRVEDEDGLKALAARVDRAFALSGRDCPDVVAKALGDVEDEPDEDVEGKSDESIVADTERGLYEESIATTELGLGLPADGAVEISDLERQMQKLSEGL